jgi:hypothetical protein
MRIVIDPSVATESQDWECEKCARPYRETVLDVDACGPYPDKYIVPACRCEARPVRKDAS